MSLFHRIHQHESKIKAAAIFVSGLMLGVWIAVPAAYHRGAAQATREAVANPVETFGRDWLTCAEVAAREGVNVRTVQYWVGRGQIIGAEKVGKSWRIPLSWQRSELAEPASDISQPVSARSESDSERSQPDSETSAAITNVRVGDDT